MGKVAIGITAVLLALAPWARAHEAGAPYSGAIIDPLVLHHAHIENEQRLNLFALRGVEAGAAKRGAAEAELELGWASDTYDFGMEAFVPLVRLPSPEGGYASGVGDVEIRPVKYAFVRRADFVVSTATAIGLPTGSRARGLGSGNTTLAQHLFVDKAWGNFYAGLNFGLERRVRGERGSGAEYGAVVAYSFIEGAGFGGLASPQPAQPLVVALSLEWLREKRLSGADAGEKEASLVPGLSFWWPKSGWQVRAGVSLPRSAAREAQRAFLLQLGNHLDWERLARGQGR